MRSTVENAAPKRFIPVIAGVAIQMCLGTAYIWSVFQTGIANYLFSGESAPALLAFSLLLALLSVGGTIGGKLQQKYGARLVIMIGGVILTLGFFLASLVKPSAPWLLWLTYGVLGGIGMGFIYSTSISCCQKWYPDKKGLISGIIVSALGFGGVIFTPIAQSLITNFGGGVDGIGELKTLALLSFIFLIVCTVGGFFMNNPPEGYKPKNYIPPVKKAGTGTQQFTATEMLKTPQFYLITATFMLACMAGLMMIGFTKPIAIAKGVTAEIATLGVMIIAIFNSFGRLFWGFISDKLGRKNTLLLLLLLTAVIILTVNIATGYLILILIAVVGFSYGGFLGTFPAITADYFGSKNMGVNYGLVMFGFGVGAVASAYIAGYYKDISNAAGDINLMMPAFIIASAASLIGAILMFLLKPPKQL